MSSMSNMLHFVLRFGLFWSNLSALSSSIDLGALAPCSTVLRSESWASAPFGAVAKGTRCSKTGQMHWIALICDQAKQNNVINHNHTYHIHIYIYTYISLYIHDKDRNLVKRGDRYHKTIGVSGCFGPSQEYHPKVLPELCAKLVR